MNNNFTERQQKTADKITSAFPTDERITQASNNSLAVMGVVGILAVIISLVYRIVTDQNPVPELLTVGAMFIAMTISSRRNHVYDIPKSFFGKELDTSMTKEGKRKRMKHYLADSLVFVVVFTLISFVAESKFVMPDALISAAIGFAVCLVMDLLLEEGQVKRYNKYLDSLESDDEE